MASIPRRVISMAFRIRSSSHSSLIRRISLNRGYKSPMTICGAWQCTFSANRKAGVRSPCHSLFSISSQIFLMPLLNKYVAKSSSKASIQPIFSIPLTAVASSAVMFAPTHFAITPLSLGIYKVSSTPVLVFARKRMQSSRSMPVT